MWPNTQETAEETEDLVTLTEEIVNGKLQLLCSVMPYLKYVLGHDIIQYIFVNRELTLFVL